MGKFILSVFSNIMKIVVTNQEKSGSFMRAASEIVYQRKPRKETAKETPHNKPQRLSSKIIPAKEHKFN